MSTIELRDTPEYRLNVMALRTVMHHHIPRGLGHVIFDGERTLQKLTVFSSTTRVSNDHGPCLYDGCDGRPAVDEWDGMFCSEYCAAQFGLQCAQGQFDECDRCGQFVPIDEDCPCAEAVAS